MTDFGIDFRSSDDFPHVRDRVAAARAQTRANAERYVQLRRTADATREEARELRAEAAELRELLVPERVLHLHQQLVRQKPPTSPIDRRALYIAGCDVARDVVVVHDEQVA